MSTFPRSRELACTAAITAAFVAFQLKASLDAGTLGLPPTYDDIGYFIDAAYRMTSGNFLRSLIAYPPHAPGSTLLATLGFAVGGIKPWAADAANAIPMFLFTLVLVRLFADLSIGLMLAAVATCFSIPVFGLAIVEFRPDMWCAGLTVLGTGLILFRDLRETRECVYAGLTFAAALLMKPTFASLVVVLFGTAFVLRFAPQLRDAKGRALVLRSFLIIGGVAVVLAGPYFWLGIEQLIRYYRVAFFGRAAIWAPDLDLKGTVLYYLTGPGGDATLGYWIYPGIAAFALIARQSWRFATLALISFVVVTVPEIKNPYLGMIFDAYIVGMIVMALSWLLTRASRRSSHLAYAIAGVSLIFAVAAYQLPWMQLHGISYSPQDAAVRKQVNSEVAAFLLADQNIDRKIICVPVITQYLNGEAIMFAALQAGRVLQPVATSYIEGDLTPHLRDIARADYIILVSADNRGVLQWLPSAKIADQISNEIEHDDRFTIGKVITSELGGVRIFERK
jgi:hypothetical protein